MDLSLAAPTPTTTVLAFACAVKVSTSQEAAAWLGLLAELTAREPLMVLANALLAILTITEFVLNALLELSGALLSRSACLFVARTPSTQLPLTPVCALMDLA